MKKKLKVKERPLTIDRLENDIWHCCQWCHYFSDGYCLNEAMFSVLDEEMLEVEQKMEVIDAKENFIDSLKERGVVQNEETEEIVRKFLDIFAGDILGIEVFASIGIENPSEHYCREYF